MYSKIAEEFSADSFGDGACRGFCPQLQPSIGFVPFVFKLFCLFHVFILFPFLSIFPFFWLVIYLLFDFLMCVLFSFCL